MGPPSKRSYQPPQISPNPPILEPTYMAGPFENGEQDQGGNGDVYEYHYE